MLKNTKTECCKFTFHVAHSHFQIKKRRWGFIDNLSHIHGLRPDPP